MLTFPMLRTGAAAQYPFTVSGSFSTEVLQFLGGDEQRYLATSGTLRRWRIELSLLDEAELAAVEEFFVASSGSFSTFTFTDPASGVSYPNCFIASDELAEQFLGELRASVSIVIEEGRG